MHLSHPLIHSSTVKSPSVQTPLFLSFLVAVRRLNFPQCLYFTQSSLCPYPIYICFVLSVIFIIVFISVVFFIVILSCPTLSPPCRYLNLIFGLTYRVLLIMTSSCFHLTASYLMLSCLILSEQHVYVYLGLPRNVRYHLIVSYCVAPDLD